MNTNTDFKTMSINKDITDADRETLFQEYNIVFRNQSKKQKKTFKENKMILEYLSKMYKNLFGKDIVKTATHRQMINGNRQRTYTYLVNESVYEHHETLYSAGSLKKGFWVPDFLQQSGNPLQNVL